MKHPTCRIITGDCLDVLRTLPSGSVDAVVTDPPYGIALDCDYSRFPKGGNEFEPIHSDEGPFEPTPILALKRPTIMWGANNYADKMPRGGWLVWQKQTNSSRFMSDCELAWTNTSRMIRCFDYAKNEGEFPSDSSRHRFHPTQKSVALMRWCLDVARIPEGATVLDPYCGSGTTGVACIQTGRNFIGIEIEPKYAAIARRRCEDAAPLFVPPPREPEPMLIGGSQ